VWHGLNWYGSGYGPVQDACINGNELSAKFFSSCTTGALREGLNFMELVRACDKTNIFHAIFKKGHLSEQNLKGRSTIRVR
jgi:hypothetical protein